VQEKVCLISLCSYITFIFSYKLIF